VHACVCVCVRVFVRARVRVFACSCVRRVCVYQGESFIKLSTVRIEMLKQIKQKDTQIVKNE
jgi:hypothetical protein